MTLGYKMNIVNIHQRDYELPLSVVSEAVNSLSSQNDLLWPKEIWMPMVLDNGLNPESRGGHGPIGYFVQQYEYGKFVEFTFTRPKEFVGTHRFELSALGPGKTRLRHTIDMQVTFKGVVMWYVVIKWLHDALLEDSLDKVHNLNHTSHVHSPHGFWVRTLRNMLRKKKKAKHTG